MKLIAVERSGRSSATSWGLTDVRFVRPDRSLLFAPVTGDVDATYSPSWLTNGNPAYPVRLSDGDLALAVAPAVAVSADVFAIHHHNIPQAATVSLSGDITSTIPTAAWRADDIPLNWFRRLTTPVSVDSITVTVTSNPSASIVGGFYAGLSYQFTDDLLIGRSFDPGLPFLWESEYSLIPPYDPGIARPRRLSGSMIMGDEDYAELQAWDLSTRNGTRPSLIIPDDDVNDAWLALFSYRETFDTAWHYVTIEIAEIPRVRW